MKCEVRTSNIKLTYCLISKFSKMRRKLFSMKSCYLLIITLLAGYSNLSAQEEVESVDLVLQPDTVVGEVKEVKNRNVMLSAESSSTPRQLNIGLPFAGDILILENDLPVVYTFWTQIPTTAWRYDSSLGRMGVMSFAEGALTFGKVGYVVTSWDREPGNKFRGYANFNTSNYGTLKYDATVTGPLGNKGWGYTLSLHETYDRGSGVNYQFTPYADRTELIKAGISKKYKAGNVKLLYKYASSKSILGAYFPFVSDGDGDYSTVSGIKPGKDSYILGSGKFPYYDYNTGEAKWADLDSDDASRTVSHTVYLTGEHRFKNKMRLNYSAMYMKSKAAFTIQYPISLSVQDADQRTDGEVYTHHGTSNVYDGAVQLVSAQYYPQVNINTFQARAELAKKVNLHNLRAGLTYQYYKAPETSYGGLYYQTVEKNPVLLDRYQDLSALGMGLYSVTQNGLLPSEGIGGYKEVRNQKAAIYLSDDMVINKWLSGGLGVRLELQNDKEIHNQYINQFQNDRELLSKDFKNKLNKVFTGNIVAKVTKDFGFLADATYNDYHTVYWDYPEDQRDNEGYPLSTGLTSEGKSIQQKVFNIGGGIYWNNGDLFSIVSKITHISKENNITSQTGYNAEGLSKMVYPIIYDIKTFGWTTDIIASPFKNFNLHFLLTLQNPQYKNYSYKVFDQVYSYNNKVIPELSKVLIEIDPSYYMFNRDLRLWLSFRYFGKQYGNPTNAFTYNGWWESFGGIDYRLSRNVDLKFQVVNILDQKGVKGALVGADQITDASPYVGRKIIAGAIRPRTFEFTASFRF